MDVEYVHNVNYLFKRLYRVSKQRGGRDEGGEEEKKVENVMQATEDAYREKGANSYRNVA